MHRKKYTFTPSRTSRGLIALVASAGLALLTGCGAGGLDATTDLGVTTVPGQQQAADLTITTQQLPAAQRDVAFPATQLQATGGERDIAWTVVAGELPEGLALTQDGRLIGSPAESGTFAVTVRASDGQQEDDQGLLVAVDVLALAIQSGLHYGEAWSGEPIRLTASGAMGTLTYEVIENTSGGTLATDNNGTRYQPGNVGPDGSVDIIRVTDTRTGQSAEVQVHVSPNPIAGFTASFGDTDVWYVDFSLKRGAHAYATDWHAALASVGLRGADSTGSLASTADQMTELLARRATLSHLNRMYLREADGTQGPEGLRISFPIERPESGFVAPGAGNWMSGAPDRFSVISVYDVNTHGTVGAALTDSQGNESHINNSPGSSLGSLGVFANRVFSSFRATYQTASRSTHAVPVGTADEAHLRRLLAGLAPSDDRGADIAFLVDGVGRSMACVLAHEIGHSCGLDHNSPSQQGAIMNNSAFIYPNVDYHFLPERLDHLRVALPGRGRRFGSTPSASAGPVAVAAQLMGLADAPGVCRGH